MFVIRPIRIDDLGALLSLTSQAGFGLTTLPHDEALLRRRIVQSIRSFEDTPDQPGGETYLFVLEEVATGHVAGTSGIAAKAGGFEPLYNYRIDTEVHESIDLHVRNEVQLLTLVTAHSGPSEIGGLFLSPDFRHKNIGRLLSLSRFLFMAEFPNAFESMVIAEIRGVVDDNGHSPFWEALGRHFFDVEFPRADYLSMVNKRFIADLMPRHPIYLFLLQEPARKVVGVPHAQSQGAMHILGSEGFRFADRVDIFDAGPVVTCPLHEIRMIRQSRRETIAATNATATDNEPLMLISNARRDFRACLGVIMPRGDGVAITPDCAAALQVQPGEPVRFAPLRPEGSNVEGS